MNRHLLAEIQGRRCHPSITILVNTTPGSALDPTHLATARRLVDVAAERLADRTDDRQRDELVERLHRLVEQVRSDRAGHALALCVSPEYEAAVSLGGHVDERVVIEETFATRDLVADLHRTAAFRLVAVSDSMLRVFLGDRHRLVAEPADNEPLRRDDDVSAAVWARQVRNALERRHAGRPLPTIVVGVKRTVASLVDADRLDVIGHVSGNHDRTAPAQLHNLAWPAVVDWKRLRHDRALRQLDDAKSSRRYASGIDEIRTLANDGRIDHLVVERGDAVSARIDGHGQLSLTDDDDRTVTDDVVDEVIEAVLRAGGQTTMMDDDALEQQGRIAAVLRY